MQVLVLNAGSSSLKASVIAMPGDETRWRDELQRAPGPDAWTDAVAYALAASRDAGGVDAVGHRVVHGGVAHRSPLVLDDAVVASIGGLRELAPLHNEPALEVITAARAALPEVLEVACFDTAFHATLPEAAYVYPLPSAWYEDWGVRRFGFHGLSVAWSVEQAAVLLGRPAGELGLVVAHLGSGCSVTAVWEGRSADTSMGMTPLEGLMMGTRAGSVDPGILLDLLDRGRLGVAELGEALQHESGLFGVSRISADLREVERAAVDGDARAALAVEMFVRRAAAAVAAAATALPRLDGIVFTGGIGEHAAEVRAKICARLGALGLPPLPAMPAADGDTVLGEPGASVPVLRVAAREDLVIAREVEQLLAGAS